MNHFTTLARYNQWMNNSFFDVCLDLGQARIERDQHAFFASILVTLNHLMIADLFWLARCTGDLTVLDVRDEDGRPIHITGLDQVLFRDIHVLYQQRKVLDEKILQYVSGLTAADLDRIVQYKTSKGVAMENPLNMILLHWFNHQTHHRGQVSAMLSQQGVDYGVTDLIYIKDRFQD